jgi:microcystin-dependent protein
MLKRLALGLAAFAVASLAHAAGTIPGFSLTPQFDLTGKVMPGCKLYVIQAGTVATPQNAYQDTGLTNLQPNPLTCDTAGRLPQWFVADGLIKVRLTDKNGVQVFANDNLLVVGPSSGGGGGGTIDPTTILSTGDVKASYTASPVSGWVRMNGRTIGSATSGATERANSDVQALFQFLWNSDANLVVSGGRGASAAADWSANKTIALPDLRGRTLAGLDDMGGSDSSRLTNSALTTVRLTLGGAGGESGHTLSLSEIPTGLTSTGIAAGTMSGSTTNVLSSTVTDFLAAGGNAILKPANTGGAAGVTVNSGSLTANVTSNNTGGTSHNLMQPTMLITYFIKL